MWRLMDAARSRPFDPATGWLDMREKFSAILSEYPLGRSESRDPLFVLMRGPEVWRAVDRLDSIFAIEDSEGVVVRHREFPVYIPQLLDHAQAIVERCCAERFKRGHKCPNCRATAYYSLDYMKLPEWLYKQEFEAKHGRSSWERYGPKAVTAE